ncbi:TniB family NTP-binding protein [Nitrospirillum pindoramense]|uniref:TniB protein n=1 Tax=Nitrospirillum amazonense TaxID=28077 RepID=A0A560H9V9_9PROT|nr:TniB family NTP-binding protein [Nitrospirillum amazonense]TWB42579.1 TniB protein [Nitrospirillum amazonense]
MDREERIERFKNISKIAIDLPHLARIKQRIRDAIDIGCCGREAQSMMLLGPTGTGKSTLLKEIADEYPPEQRDRYLYHPVLYVGIPPQSTLKALAIAILKALGDVSSNRSMSEYTHIVIQMLTRAAPKLLILDEIQHIVSAGNKRANAYASGDLIKSILNAAVCPIILGGQPEGAELIRANPQSLRRNRWAEYLEPFDWLKQEDRDTYQSFLYMYEERMGLSAPSNLFHDDMAFRLWIASNGAIGETTKWLQMAAEIALVEQESSLPCISKELLAEAFDRGRLGANRQEPNPFLSDKHSLKVLRPPTTEKLRLPRLRKGDQALRELL